MPAGTIALTNNSKTVTGTGTAFTTELKANDFIVATVGGVTYTLGIESVDSATALTLIKAYNGSTVSGAAWTPLPAAAMSLISAQTAADVARALRTANFDKVNWQQVFSELGDITVTLPDGTQFSGPSWRKIADLLAGLDPVELQQIADQVNSDAQQVSADKQTASQAKTDAVVAKNDAVTAKNSATASATQAAGSATSAGNSATTATNQATEATAQAVKAKAEADRAAQSGVSLDMVDAHLAPWGFGNTGALTAYASLNTIDRSIHFIFTGTATGNPVPGTGGRGLMIVESSTYATQIVWMNGTGASFVRFKSGTTWSAWADPLASLASRIGYALVDFGSISASTRTVIANPFGNNTPVETLVEVNLNNVWGYAPGLYSATTSSGYGISGGSSPGEGLVIQACAYLYTNSVLTGGTHNWAGGSGTSPRSVRMHVWKTTN